MARRWVSVGVAARRLRVALLAGVLVACGSPVVPSATPATSSAPPSSPFVLNVTTEATTATTELIGPAGGTITTTSEAGLTFEFVVPPLAFPTAIEITMTPIRTIDGLPLSGGFVAGVDFAPSGLVLAQPGTLTITSSRQPGAGQHVVGFSYEDGADSFHLRPASAGAEGISIGVSHFSTAAAGFGTTQDIEALWVLQTNNPTPGTSQAAFEALVGRSVREPRDGADELKLMELWFDAIILPELEAVTTDAQLLDASGAYQLWLYLVPRFLGIYQVVPGGQDAPSLVSRRTTWEAAFATKARLAVERNLQLCAGPGLTSGRVAALDNAIFWSRMARLGYAVATDSNGLDLASFRAASCAQAVSQDLTLVDPLRREVSSNLDVTFALRFTDGVIVPANFTVTATGQGAALQFPERSAMTPPGFYSGVVTPTNAASVVTIDLEACYAGVDFVVIIGAGGELCHAQTIVREVGAAVHTCAGDPTTLRSIDDDPDKIYVVFDGVSTCQLIAEVGDDHFPGDGSNVVLSIDTDPNETTWDGEDSDDDADGLNWQEVGGFGQDFASGSTHTFRSRFVATGQVFTITVTVRVERIGGRDTRMTVENVSITQAP